VTPLIDQTYKSRALKKENGASQRNIKRIQQKLAENT
jgi:hypothetical protein